MGPSHGLQFFKNCPSMDPFHRMQSFRNGLFQCGSPTGSQVLPENLHLHGLLFMGLISCQVPVPVWAVHGLQLHLGDIHLLWCALHTRGGVDSCSTVVLHGLEAANPLHHGLLQGLQGNLQWRLPQAPPPPPSLTFVSAGVFFTLCPHSSFSCFAAQCFLLFLK